MTLVSNDFNFGVDIRKFKIKASPFKHKSGTSSSYSFDTSNEYWKEDMSAVSLGSVEEVFHPDFKLRAQNNVDLINFEKKELRRDKKSESIELKIERVLNNFRNVMKAKYRQDLKSDRQKTTLLDGGFIVEISATNDNAVVQERNYYIKQMENLRKGFKIVIKNALTEAKTKLSKLVQTQFRKAMYVFNEEISVVVNQFLKMDVLLAKKDFDNSNILKQCVLNEQQIIGNGV